MPAATASRGRRNPFNKGLGGLLARKPGSILGRQIDHQTDHGEGFIGQAPDAQTPDFNHAG